MSMNYLVELMVEASKVGELADEWLVGVMGLGAFSLVYLLFILVFVKELLESLLIVLFKNDKIKELIKDATVQKHLTRKTEEGRDPSIRSVLVAVLLMGTILVGGYVMGGDLLEDVESKSEKMNQAEVAEDGVWKWNKEGLDVKEAGEFDSHIEEDGTYFVYTDRGGKEKKEANVVSKECVEDYYVELSNGETLVCVEKE